MIYYYVLIYCYYNKKYFIYILPYISIVKNNQTIIILGFGLKNTKHVGMTQLYRLLFGSRKINKGSKLITKLGW